MYQSGYGVLPEFFGILGFVLFVVPVLFVFFSNRAVGSGKVGWMIITLCLSWLGFGAYLVCTQKKID